MSCGVDAPQLSLKNGWPPFSMKDFGPEGARVPRLVGSGVTPSLHYRARAIHACEPCRQRKVKFDGERPTYGKCQHLNVTCSFGASRRDGKKR